MLYEIFSECIYWLVDCEHLNLRSLPDLVQSDKQSRLVSGRNPEKKDLHFECVSFPVITAVSPFTHLFQLLFQVHESSNNSSNALAPVVSFSPLMHVKISSPLRLNICTAWTIWRHQYWVIHHLCLCACHPIRPICSAIIPSNRLLSRLKQLGKYTFPCLFLCD